MWPQLWMVLRLAAELLVAVDDPEPAAVLLAAADEDPLSPSVYGPDLERQTALRAAISDRLGDQPQLATRDGVQDRRSGAARRALAALAGPAHEPDRY